MHFKGINGTQSITLDMTDEQIKNLKKQLEEKGRWKPKKKDKYYFVGGMGTITSDYWIGSSVDDGYLSMGNCQHSKEAAEMYKLRLQSIAEAWWPKDGEGFYFWNFDCEDSAFGGTTESIVRFPETYIGSCHPTKEACEEWHKKFGIAFDYLIKNK
jgi:hypothetical protein